MKTNYELTEKDFKYEAKDFVRRFGKDAMYLWEGEVIRREYGKKQM